MFSLSLFYRPDLIDMSYVSTQPNRSNLENAFYVAEQLGVARLLDPEGEIHSHCVMFAFTPKTLKDLNNFVLLIMWS